ncbi:hypothetical protein D3C81_1807950 [compost metagenome]
MGGEAHPATHGGMAGRDGLGPARSQHRVPVEVAPVEGVHGKERRHDAQGLQVVQLIHTGGLAVDQDRAAVLGAVAVRGVAHRADEQVDGGVAVGVDLDLPVVPEGQFDSVQRLLLGHGGIAAIGGRLALGRDVVGL